MPKKHKQDFRIMSTKECTHRFPDNTTCEKLLKMNVVERQPNADKCYKHESPRRKSGHAKRER